MMDDLARLVDKRYALREEVEGLSATLEAKKKQQSQIFAQTARAAAVVEQEPVAPHAAKRKRILIGAHPPQPAAAEAAAGQRVGASDTSSCEAARGAPRRSVFGLMVNHLNKALEEERSGQFERSREQQKVRLALAETKEKQQQWDFVDEEIRELELTLVEKCWAVDQLDLEIRAKKRRYAITQVIKQWSVMENFIRTATEPCLFWKPHKHNSQTRRLQDDTRHEIQQKLKNLQSPPLVGRQK